MVDYLYDGSFDGLLTCIYCHYYLEPAGGIYTEHAYQPNMLVSSQKVDSDPQKAQRVYRAISAKISYEALQRIFKIFRSSDEDKEKLILNYLCLGFQVGPEIHRLHGNDIVFRAQQVERKVNNEIHRFKGLIRFSVFGESTLYAPLVPDHDILEFLGPHFSDRYRNDPFIIHDEKRNKALIGAKGQWYVTDFQRESLLKPDQEELDYRRLWQNYFTAIAIKERTNKKCQRNFMPVRYWKHLTEMTPGFQGFSD